MKKNFQTLMLSIAMLSAVQTFAGHLTDRIILSARLQGSNEVPAVATSANGVASFMLNATRDTMQVNIAFTGLKATAMHIHEGKAGANGGVFKDLTKNIKGNVARLILTGTDLSPANLSKFQNIINLDLNDVMPGTYILTVLNNGKSTATTTFVKI